MDEQRAQGFEPTEGAKATQGFKATRWLAWAAAGLVVAGAVSVGTVSSAKKETDTRIVTAAGGATGGVDLATTAPPPTAPVVPSPPPTTAESVPTPPTTLVKATTTTAKASATTTPRATAPPTTTSAVRSTTTVPPVTATTVTTIAGRATVTIVSQYAYDVDVTINGQVFRVAANQTVGPIDLALAANGNDVVEGRLVVRPTCGIGDAGGYFTAGGNFRLSIVSVPGMCFDLPGFTLKSTPI